MWDSPPPPRESLMKFWKLKGSTIVACGQTSPISIPRVTGIAPDLEVGDRKSLTQSWSCFIVKPLTIWRGIKIILAMIVNIDKLEEEKSLDKRSSFVLPSSEVISAFKKGITIIL